MEEAQVERGLVVFLAWRGMELGSVQYPPASIADRDSWVRSGIPPKIDKLATNLPFDRLRRWLAVQTIAAVVNFAAQKIVIDYVFCHYYPSSNTVAAFTDLSLIERLWICVVQMSLGWLFLSNANRIVAIIAVAAYLSTPENCPPSYGSLADCYSVRNFWGKAWHQTFKWVRWLGLHSNTLFSFSDGYHLQYFNTTGDLVARGIGAKKGTLLSKYTKLHIAFLISGVQHYVATIFVRSDAWSWAMLGQMVIYAIIITIEDGLKSLGQRMGLKPGSTLQSRVSHAEQTPGLTLLHTVFTYAAGYLWCAFWIPYVYQYPFIYYIDVGFFNGSCPVWLPSNTCCPVLWECHLLIV